MNKSTFFSGQPVFSQLIKLIPESLISNICRRHNTDHYYKTFKTRDHLISMLYACFHNCSSLREVITGLEASYNKFIHLKLQCIPRRSTLADANSSREVLFLKSCTRSCIVFIMAVYRTAEREQQRSQGFS